MKIEKMKKLRCENVKINRMIVIFTELFKVHLNIDITVITLLVQHIFLQQTIGQLKSVSVVLRLCERKGTKYSQLSIFP